MKALPDVFVDTSGYAFTFPLFKMFGKCKVGCYVHYPTISTDMLSQVRSRTSTYNNRSRISNSWLLSYLKFLYYKVRFFEFLYVNMLLNRGYTVNVFVYNVLKSIVTFSYLRSYTAKPESIQT